MQRREGIKDWQVDRRIGNAVFKLDFIKHNGRDAIDKAHMKILKCEEWVIIKYCEEGWEEIFSCIEVCHIKKLWIGMASIPNIIGHISNTAFMGLIQLHLFQNQIASIESLAKMRFPHLFILDISRNNIATLACMKYINMPKLGGLVISGNPVKSLSVLAQCNLKHLDVLNLEWPTSPVMDESLEWLAKVNSKRIRMTRCESEDRIVPNEIVGKMLKRRHKDMRIKYLQKTAK